MPSSLYLEEAIESDLDIKFRQVNKEEIARLQMELDNAADRLGVDAEEVRMPQKGVLVKELTILQRNMIGHLLAGRYAENNAGHQRQLQQVPIQESFEKMLSVVDVLDREKIDYKTSSTFFHEACGEYGGKDRIWFLREGVLSKLIPVFRAFNQIGIRPHLEDCYRPKEVQEGLLLRRIVDLARIWKEWNWETVRTVGMSLTAPVSGLAGHQAGAALDLRLQKKDGIFLPLGNEYAEGTVISSIDCPYVTFDQLHTRMLFSQIMRMGNFRLLPTENWHISHGDRGLGIDSSAHARPIRMHSAIYGPLQDFDTGSGVIIPYEIEAIDRPYLSDEDMEHLVNLARKQSFQNSLQVIERFRQKRS